MEGILLGVYRSGNFLFAAGAWEIARSNLAAFLSVSIGKVYRFFVVFKVKEWNFIEEILQDTNRLII